VDEIIGQARAIDILQASLQSGRLHHAYIFHGPAGVGKFTTAVAFAKVLLCHEPQRDLSGRVIACDACPSCRLLGKDGGDQGSARAHPDFHVVTKELARFSDDAATRNRKLMNIPVEVLETHMLTPVYRASQLRHNKVFIVDEAELIDPRTGQNPLLKTLEEPPAGTFIILVTSSEDKLLPTIRSRCQRVAFLPLPDEAIEKWADKNIADLPANHRKWLVEFSGGSLGRVRLAVTYDLAAWARAVLPALEQMAQGKFVAGLGPEIAAKMNAFAERWVEEHDGASKEAANKLAASLMWTLISQRARRKMAELSAAAPAGDVEATEVALAPWLGVIDALAEAEMEIASNVNMGLATDHLVSRLYRALVGGAAVRG
jgi:DNA polymerase-3 subunit delta'